MKATQGRKASFQLTGGIHYSWEMKAVRANQKAERCWVHSSILPVPEPTPGNGHDGFFHTVNIVRMKGQGIVSQVTQIDNPH